MRTQPRARAGHSLVVRLDNLGDVLLAGPSVRAVAAGSERVSVLCGPAGAEAATLLDGVDEVLTYRAPWIADPAPPVEQGSLEALVGSLRRLEVDRAIVLTSFHQSPLPTALVLKMAGIGFVAAHSDDYPGSLLDLRHRAAGDRHEVERSLDLAAAAGFPAPPGDGGQLAVAVGDLPTRREGRVVVHPGASMPARTLSAGRFTEIAATLARAGYEVVVTGSAAEARLAARIAREAPGARAVTGTSLADLARLLASASAVVVGNTGPAHLAAAVSTPVVSLFAPTVPAARWRPWGVPNVLLGDQDVPCALCRSRRCPRPVQDCLETIAPRQVLAALASLGARPCRTAAGAPA